MPAVISNPQVQQFEALTSSHSITHFAQDQSEEALFRSLAHHSSIQQWVWFTSESCVPCLQQLRAHNITNPNIIHMKPSKTLNEVETVVKAIQSRNASLIVASNRVPEINQIQLQSLAHHYNCEVLFINSLSARLH